MNLINSLYNIPIPKFNKQPKLRAQKLDNIITNLDVLLKGVKEGKGTLGQLAENPSLFNHADAAADSASKLITDMRNDPKKYLVIRLKLF